MPKIPIDTLKQIQKNQGLSISIVDSGKTAIETPATRDTRSKQTTLDKQNPPKIHIVGDDAKKSVRTPVPEKVSSSQNRLTPSETKTTHVATKQNVFYEPNSSVQSKANQHPQSVPENKIFSAPSRNNSMSSENKSQANNTRIMQNLSSTSDSKVQSTPGRILTPQSSRNVQNVNMLAEKPPPQKATPHRGTPISQRTPISEPKTLMTQSRVTQSHPARYEGKVIQGNRSSSNVNIMPEKNTSNKMILGKQIPATIESKGQTARMPKELLEGKNQANTAGRIVVNNPETVTSHNQNRINKNITNNFVETRTNSGQRNVLVMTPDGGLNKLASLRQADLKGQKVLNIHNISLPESKGQGINVDGTAKSFTPKFVIADQVHEIGIKREANKRPVTSSPVAKKKCVARSTAGRRTGSNLNLCEEIPANEQHFINNLKNRPAGLSITPVNSRSANLNSSANSSNISSKIDTGHSDPIIEEPPDEDSNPMYCSKCKIFLDCGSQWCPTCNNKLSLTNSTGPIEPYIVQNVTTNVTVSKRIFFKQDIRQQASVCGNRSFHIEKNVVIKTGSVVQTSPRSKGRPKRRKEPVCLTLSSDEEEPTQEFNAFQETMSNINIFPLESEGSKSDQSGPELQEDEENEDSDDEFPGVTDIHPKMDHEEEEFEEEQDEEEMMAMDEDCEDEEEEGLSAQEEEEEEVPPEDEEEEMMQEKNVSINASKSDEALRCRSIRIGSYKVHPFRNSHLTVSLEPNYISFCVPTVREPIQYINITLKTNDVTRMLVHFGRCLPIVFVYTTAAFGEALRKALKMVEGQTPYFDPTSNDDRQEKITFLIDSLTEDHRRFLRETFPGDQKVKEIDQKTANEILVKSTPQHSQLHSIQLKTDPVMECQTTRSMAAAMQQHQLTIKAIPTVPVTKILTYPPPPQTGGIPITSEDLACLNEGEFLNDVIIDFYLKYVFSEKLSEYYKEKTHIFSSYFYPRLTSKTDKQQKGEDGLRTLQVRRHSQVKTWTRHIDIFSKDFIIIPINQNVHWFLAIICYPGRVPDAPPLSVEEEANKTSDTVTSTNDQDEGNKSINKDQSSNADGISPNSDENSMPSSNNSLYEAEESPDSEEALPEAPDSSTHPDTVQQDQKRKETPCICIFDSLSGPNRWKIAATLREYLEMEWKMKKGTRRVFDKNTMHGLVFKCPQQTNFSDCGVYLLQYVESFFENPIPYFGNPMPDLSNWFPENKITKKRQEIRELILSLQKKQSPSSAS